MFRTLVLTILADALHIRFWGFWYFYGYDRIFNDQLFCDRMFKIIFIWPRFVDLILACIVFISVLLKQIRVFIYSSQNCYIHSISNLVYIMQLIVKSFIATTHYFLHPLFCSVYCSKFITDSMIFNEDQANFAYHFLTIMKNCVCSCVVNFVFLHVRHETHNWCSISEHQCKNTISCFYMLDTKHTLGAHVWAPRTVVKHNHIEAITLRQFNTRKMGIRRLYCLGALASALSTDIFGWQ